MMYLILAICCSTAISILMRLSEKHSRSAMGMLATNYLACALLAAAYTGPRQLFPAQEGMGLTLALGAVGGILYLGGFVLMRWNISRNGVVLPSTFMKLGVIVPTALSILVFGETPRLMQVIGIGMALLAIFLMHEKSGKGSVSIPGLVVLMLCGGSSDALSKVFEEIGPAALKDHFLLYIFIMALLACTALCLLQRQKPDRMDLLFGLAIGVPNYYAARFLLLSLESVPAMIAYPCFSVGTIVLVAVLGVICFRERLSRRKLEALLVILAALILLNV